MKKVLSLLICCVFLLNSTLLGFNFAGGKAEIRKLLKQKKQKRAKITEFLSNLRDSIAADGLTPSQAGELVENLINHDNFPTSYYDRWDEYLGEAELLADVRGALQTYTAEQERIAEERAAEKKRREEAAKEVREAREQEDREEAARLQTERTAAAAEAEREAKAKADAEAEVARRRWERDLAAGDERAANDRRRENESAAAAEAELTCGLTGCQLSGAGAAAVVVAILAFLTTNIEPAALDGFFGKGNLFNH